MRPERDLFLPLGAVTRPSGRRERELRTSVTRPSGGSAGHPPAPPPPLPPPARCPRLECRLPPTRSVERLAAQSATTSRSARRRSPLRPDACLVEPAFEPTTPCVFSACPQLFEPRPAANSTASATSFPSRPARREPVDARLLRKQLRASGRRSPPHEQLQAALDHRSAIPRRVPRRLRGDRRELGPGLPKAARSERVQPAPSSSASPRVRARAVPRAGTDGVISAYRPQLERLIVVAQGRRQAPSARARSPARR